VEKKKKYYRTLYGWIDRPLPENNLVVWATQNKDGSTGYIRASERRGNAEKSAKLMGVRLLWKSVNLN